MVRYSKNEYNHIRIFIEGKPSSSRGLTPSLYITLAITHTIWDQYKSPDKNKKISASPLEPKTGWEKNEYKNKEKKKKKNLYPSNVVVAPALLSSHKLERIIRFPQSDIHLNQNVDPYIFKMNPQAFFTKSPSDTYASTQHPC